MARPTKFSPERAKRYLDVLAAGGTKRLAAANAGVDEVTAIRWAHRYASFAEDVRMRETDAELVRVATMQRCALGGQVLSRKTTVRPDGTRIVEETYQPADGRLALEMQARLHPQEWGRTDRVEINIRERAQALADELGVAVDVVLAEAFRQAGGPGGQLALGSGR